MSTQTSTATSVQSYANLRNRSGSGLFPAGNNATNNATSTETGSNVKTQNAQNPSSTAAAELDAALSNARLFSEVMDQLAAQNQATADLYQAGTNPTVDSLGDAIQPTPDSSSLGAETSGVPADEITTTNTGSGLAGAISAHAKIASGTADPGEFDTISTRRPASVKAMDLTTQPSEENPFFVTSDTERGLPSDLTGLSEKQMAEKAKKSPSLRDRLRKMLSESLNENTSIGSQANMEPAQIEQVARVLADVNSSMEADTRGEWTIFDVVHRKYLNETLALSPRN